MANSEPQGSIQNPYLVDEDSEPDLVVVVDPTPQRERAELAELQEPSPTRAPPAPAPQQNDLSADAFALANVADQPRRPWAYGYDKDATIYVPQEHGKWWSEENMPAASQARGGSRDYGHICRIMETELGVRLEGNDRCTACQREGAECWAYSEDGAKQVSRPGSSCARCRVVARPGGCSVSKRKAQKLRRSAEPQPAALRTLEMRAP